MKNTGFNLNSAVMSYAEAYRMGNLGKMSELEMELARHNVDHRTLMEMTNEIILAGYGGVRRKTV